MKKDNKIMKFVSFVLLITVIALILVAGTYAKYTSTASGSDTATVAKWDIKAGVKDNEVSITGTNPTVAFNLFDTILNDDGTAETAVVTDETTGKVIKIAPGTSGKFELSVKNDSEVNAEYSVNFLVRKANTENEASNVPLKFKVNNAEEWSDSLEAVSADAIAMGTSEIVTVEWIWDYERTDKDGEDTALGITPEEVEVVATLVVDQVN